MPYADYEKQKQQAREYYRRNRDRVLRYMKTYYQENREDRDVNSERWRRNNRDWFREYYRKWRKEKGAESTRLSGLKWKTGNKDKTKAHAEVRNAIRRGDIKRLPCEICGEIKSQAHHHDYSKPLDVKFLCSLHHKEEHHASR